MRIGHGSGSIYKVESMDMFSLRCGTYNNEWDGTVVKHLTLILKQIKRIKLLNIC